MFKVSCDDDIEDLRIRTELGVAAEGVKVIKDGELSNIIKDAEVEQNAVNKIPKVKGILHQIQKLDSNNVTILF
jgi:ribosomal protein L15